MLRSPKSKFIGSAHKDEFAQIITKAAFEEALLTAMLEMQCEQPAHCSPNDAADAHNQLAGARRFVEIFTTIHQPETQSKQPTPKELKWGAGV